MFWFVYQKEKSGLLDEKKNIAIIELFSFLLFNGTINTYRVCFVHFLP